MKLEGYLISGLSVGFELGDIPEDLCEDWESGKALIIDLLIFRLVISF